MKVYMHLEDTSPMTVVINTEEPGYTVLSAIHEFCREAIKHAKQIDPGNVSIQKKNGKALSQSACLCDVASNREDLWVKVKEQPKAVPPPVKKEEVKPKPRDEIKKLKKQAEKYCKDKQERKAIAVYEDILKIEPNHLPSLLAIGDIYLSANRPKRARKYYKEAEKHHPRDLLAMRKLAECLLEQRRGDEALEILLDYGKQLRQSGRTSEEEKFQLQVLLCKAYQLKDQKDMAIVVAQGLVRQSREYIPGLVEFAKLTYDLGELQAYEAITVLLTAMVMHRDDKYIAKQFAEACQKPGGLQHLEKSANESWNNVNAIVFMANTLRDNGAVEEAVTLLEHAMSLEPHNPALVLNYVHNLEVLHQPDKAIATIRKFLEDYKPLALNGVSNNDILEALDNGTPDPEYIDLSRPPQNLHLLALWFTLVKVLYFHQQTAPLRQLVELLGPLHQGRNLHLTLIRNEAAYFACIHLVVKKCDPIPAQPTEEEGSSVYFIGDSHCTTPAWRHITIKGSRHMVRPALCTGTKLWHVRAASSFYPRRSFLGAVGTVPRRGLVVVCLGEIDCREGLLRATERCRYDSVEAAMDAVIDIYMNVFRELQHEKEWTVLIHPVPPVLDITRPQVVEFNRRLAARLDKEPNLHWLDFADKLLEGNELKLEYSFDGTHLNPSYLPLLEDAINAVLS